MKYLVTGATGLVGNNVVRQLLAAGEEVRVLARSASDPRPLAGLAVERCPGDVRDAASMAAACEGVNIVIHSAGHVHLGWLQREQHQAVNVEGARNVASAARAAGARLVHVSAINALGLGKLRAPADEESGLPGIIECPYVATKRESERVVLAEVERGLDAVIVNPGFMLGPWDWKPSSGKMLLAVTRFAPVYPTGAVSFCDVRDVAAGVIAAARKGRTGRRYILAGHNLSYLEGWRQMARLVGKRGPISPMGPLFRVAAAPVLDVVTWLTGFEGEANSAVLALGKQEHCFTSRRACEELGYSIRPFSETLADAWAWLQEFGYVQKAADK
jgi:dihydroflavonol-4-reductase